MLTNDVYLSVRITRDDKKFIDSHGGSRFIRGAIQVLRDEAAKAAAGAAPPRRPRGRQKQFRLNGP